jgi:hypothetical protein
MLCHLCFINHIPPHWQHLMWCDECLEQAKEESAAGKIKSFEEFVQRKRAEARAAGRIPEGQ